jgi:nucleotide-binding universal stress UspA family protein
MLEIRRVLCPVDFSDASARGLKYAIVLARWYGARVTVLHVADVRADGLMEPSFESTPRRGAVLAPVETERIVQAIAAFVNERAHPDVSFEPMVRLGRPSIEILQAADAVSADLIVMGTHGHAGFDRLVMGSVTEKVVRKSQRPVLSVPPHAACGRESPVAIERILCPVVFSEPAMKTLQCAVSLAEEADACLTVVHVADVLSAHAFPVYDRLDLPALQAEHERQLRYRLREFVPIAARAYCTIDEQVRAGTAWREIIALAEERQAQMIVMGVTARTAPDTTAFGSTTEQVVRQAPCPVLTMR